MATVEDITAVEEPRNLGDNDNISESVTSDSFRTTDIAVEESVTSDTPQNPAEAAEEPEDSATSEEPDDIEDEPKRKGVGKRIDELVKEREEAKRDRDHWRELAMSREKSSKPTESNEPAAKEEETHNPEPNVDNYDTVAEYTQAFVDWKLKNSTAEMEKRIEAKIKSEQDRAQINATVESKIADGRERYKDFDKVALKPDIPYSETMAEVVRESSMTADLGFYFGINPEEAKRVAVLSPTQCAKEIGKIEAALEQAFAMRTADDTAPDNDAPPQRITRPPVPIRTVGRSDSVRANDETLSPAEYAKRHNLAVPWKT